MSIYIYTLFICYALEFNINSNQFKYYARLEYHHVAYFHYQKHSEQTHNNTKHEKYAKLEKTPINQYSAVSVVPLKICEVHWSLVSVHLRNYECLTDNDSYRACGLD